jgi:hypothetical protein
MLYSVLTLLQNILDGGVITIYLALIISMRTWFGVRERGVSDMTLTTDDNLPTGIQMHLKDYLSRALRTWTR